MSRVRPPTSAETCRAAALGLGTSRQASAAAIMSCKSLAICAADDANTVCVLEARISSTIASALRGSSTGEPARRSWATNARP